MWHWRHSGKGCVEEIMLAWIVEEIKVWTWCWRLVYIYNELYKYSGVKIEVRGKNDKLGEYGQDVSEKKWKGVRL